MAIVGDEAKERDGERHAQAVRFLVSLQASKKNNEQQQDDETAQRDFLRSKGLDEAAIDRAYADARLPEHLSSAVATDAAAAAAATDAASPTDAATKAFDRAKRQFEAPLDPSPSSPSEDVLGTEPQLPPKTYPRSPLALYQSQQQANAMASAAQQQQLSGPTTRYEVLLAFFRSMSFFLMLGGGFAAILVGLYRAYMLPRLVSTLDARSDLLKHHHDLFNTLFNRVKKLRSSASFSPTSSTESEGNLSTSSPKRGVLKRVQFADEVGNDSAAAAAVPPSSNPAAEEVEDKKEAGDVVLPGTDVVVSAKTAASDEKGEKRKSSENGEDGEGDEKQSLLHGEEKEGAEIEEARIVPIDVTAPLRSSLSKLAEVLKADFSSQALQPASSMPAAGVPNKTPTVADEEESDDDDDEDDDELEFDPFAPPKVSTNKKKHTTTSPVVNATATSGTDAAIQGKATSLRSSLSAINANIAAQMYTANASQYGSRSFGGFGSSLTSSFGGATSASSAANGTSSNKTVDVAQIRADIRNLKGLLLSRRNFPIYSRPSSGIASSASAATSAAS